MREVHIDVNEYSEEARELQPGILRELNSTVDVGIKEKIFQISMRMHTHTHIHTQTL